ncbi:prepilin peptidase [Streptomyces sp. NPDC002851]
MLTALAACYGALAGLLVPRAAHRLAVAPGEPWRADCPDGHPLTGPARGWLGAPRCPTCATTPYALDAGEGRLDTGEGRLGAEDSQLAPRTPHFGPRTARLGPHPAYPIAVTALVCAALAAATGYRPELVVWLVLAPFGVLLAAVDLAVHRLPDVLTLPLAAAAVALLGAAAPFPAAAGSWPGALLGGLALGGAYLLLFLARPSALGFGDVKLALVLGVTLGWYGSGALILGFLSGTVYAAGHALALVLRGRAGLKTAMPLGPCMLAGAVTGLLLGGFAA